VNETAMKQLGYENPVEIIGQEINWSIGSYQLAYGPDTGVIKDYHQESLKNKVDPLVMVLEPLWLQNFLIKLETKNVEQTIAQVENVWNDLFPFALEYAFLDELYNQLYQQDRVQLKLLSGFTLIAIFIAFMGLISLVAYALRSRSRELAIRRVIGANLASLTTMIGKEYFWIVTLSAVVGIPLSYMWVSQWLQNFAYHIEVSPLIYACSIIIIYMLLFATIYLQTLKATVDNPVEALREE
jgi:putative ABC transport system permease protein